MAEGASFNAETNSFLKQIQNNQKEAAKRDEKAAEERAAAADKQEEQLELDKRIEALTKKADDRKKQIATDDKVAQAEQLERLDNLGITNSDVADTVLQDLKNNITWQDEELQQLADNAKALSDRDKRDAKDKRKKEKLEEERLASNLKAEASLSGLLQLGFINKENADRLAKRAMQVKESVHKWWEDKKEKMASGAKSILQWLMTAAGLGLIWGIFKLLAKVDWVKLYEDMKLWVDLLWTGLTRFFAFKGLQVFGKWLKGTKFVRFITAAFRSVINLIKLVLGGGLRGLLKVFNFLTKGVFKADGAIGKRIKSVISWFKGGKGGLPAKIAEMWKKATTSLKAGLSIAKGWGTTIKNFFGSAKGSLVAKIKSIWQAATGGVMKALNPAINAIKTAIKPITAFFSTGKGATGAGGVFTKIKDVMTKVMPKVDKAMTFVKGIAKTFAKFFAPITVFMAAWAAISGGLDEAEKESGGFPQKILSFISGALKGLIDFFVFDLANLIQDGIKWAIGWFMGLFGFSEKEIEAATDFDFVKPIRDAVMDAIDWVRDLFRFDGKGVDFSKLAKFIDILLWPLNQAIKWIRELFGWDTDKDGKKKKDFSIGEVITDALTAIFKWLGDLFKIDFGALAKNIMPEALYNFLFDKGSKAKQDLNKLGFIDEDLIGKDDLELDKIKAEIAKRKKEGGDIRGLISALAGVAKDESIDAGDRKKLTKMLKAEGATLATGGLFSGGMALVGESGPEIMVSTIPAKVIPAKETTDMMAGMGGGQNFAPTTIVNSAPTSTSTIMASSSLNPVSQKYFRSD